MTGYYLSPGYQSAGSREEAWEQMKVFVGYYREMPEMIFDEAVRVERVDYPNELRECAGLCGSRVDGGLTLSVREAEADEEAAIVQFASGTGEYREAKEQCRRAFCRLIIAECHKRGIEVNMTVA